MLDVTPRMKTLFWSHVDMSGGPDACWPRKKVPANRYGTVTITTPPGHAKRINCHKVAWEITNGPVPDGLRVLHQCDNRPCCNPRHLFLGTQKDNIQDAMRKGRMPTKRRGLWVVAAESGLVRVGVAARRLGISRKWLRHLAVSGKIPFTPVGPCFFYYPHDVEALREYRAQNPSPKKPKVAG